MKNKKPSAGLAEFIKTNISGSFDVVDSLYCSYLIAKHLDIYFHDYYIGSQLLRETERYAIADDFLLAEIDCSSELALLSKIQDSLLSSFFYSCTKNENDVALRTLYVLDKVSFIREIECVKSDSELCSYFEFMDCSIKLAKGGNANVV